MGNIIDELHTRVRDRPDDPLYTFLDGAGRVAESYTYREFHERTDLVAAALEESGQVGCGDRVLLIYPPGLDFIVAFIACVKLGALPVPVAPPDASGFVGGVERLTYITGDAGARVALTNDAYLNQFKALEARSPEAAFWLGAPPLASLHWLATGRLIGRARIFTPPTGGLLFLQYTSGSTQTPRGVMVSHDNVIRNCWATLTHRPIGVSWLPHYHDMGLIGYYLFIMVTGGSMYGFSGAHFLKRPLLWLETITRFRGTITSAPNFAFEYCLRDDKVPSRALPSIDLSSMCCMMNASEPVRATTYDRFLEKFEPCGLSPKASVVFYGLAENTLSVTGNGRVQLTVNHHLIAQNHLRIETPRPDRYNQLSLVSCGRPLGGVDLRIVDPKTRGRLSDDLIGEVWVGGDSKAGGYWNKPEASRDLFKASIDESGGSQTYLRTGDLGFIHDGELFICSRLKDMIIIGGRNHYPADIEAVVERAAPAVRPGCVAAFGIDKSGSGEGVVVLAEARRANDLPDLEAICLEVRKRCQVEIDTLALVPHGTIPKTSSGKIARQACKSRWEAGDVPVIASRVRPESPQIDALIANLLNRLDIDGYQDRTLAELGIDSLTLVDLSVHLESLWKTQRPAPGSPADEGLFDLRILQAITAGELRAFFTALSIHGELPAAAPRLYAGRLASIEREERAAMRRDAMLPDDIRPRPAKIPSSGRVLLTGATGFLGSFLLEALLRLTDYEIVTLVRAEDADHAAARTESALRRTGRLDAVTQPAFAARVRSIGGDLARPRLGVSDDDWAWLAREVSGIYHCGAEVDYVKPYQSLHAPNVASTLDLIRLACEGQPKAIHFASTTFTFGFVSRDVCREIDANAEMAGLNFGYSQTKWVAEQLVLEGIRRGLSARIYRPSLISASRDGRYVRRDLTARILSYMIRQGVSVDSANQISLLPVDVCANNLVALSLLDDPMPSTFHLTADDYYTMQAVCSTIGTQSGYRFEYLSLEQFIRHMNAHCTKDDPLFPLVAFFNQNYRQIDQMRDKRYDSRHYRLERARSVVTLPHPPLGHTVGGIVAFLQRENLVPAPPAQKMSAV
jgi:thioester reductase-like protein